MSGSTTFLYEPVYLNHLIIELYNYMCEVDSNHNSHTWAKLRSIVHTGVRILSTRVDVIAMSGLTQSSPSQEIFIQKHAETLKTLIAIPMQDILAKRENYFDFAKIAYELQEFGLLALSIKNGARLTCNSYFMSICTQYENQPEYKNTFDLLQTLVSSSNISLPWEALPNLPNILMAPSAASTIQEESLQIQAVKQEQSLNKASVLATQATLLMQANEAQALQAQHIEQHIQMRLEQERMYAFAVGKQQGFIEAQNEVLLQQNENLEQIVRDQKTSNILSQHPVIQEITTHQELEAVTQPNTTTPEIVKESEPQTATDLKTATEQETTTEPLEISESTVIVERQKTEKEIMIASIDQFNILVCNDFLQKIEMREKFLQVLTLQMQYTCKKSELNKLSIFIAEINLSTEECLLLLCHKKIIKDCKRALLNRFISLPKGQLFEISKKYDLLNIAGDVLDKNKQVDKEFKLEFKNLLKQCTNDFSLKTPEPVAAPSKQKEKAAQTQQAPKIKQPKTVVLTTLEILHKAITERDHITINRLLSENEADPIVIIDPLYAELCKNHAEFSDEFVDSLQFPKYFYTNILSDPGLPITLFIAFTRAIINFAEPIYYIESMKLSLNKLVASTLTKHGLSDEKLTLNNRSYKLCKMLKEKNAQSTKLLIEEVQYVANQIQNIEPGTELKINCIEYATNFVDSNRNSLLMLALEKRLHLNTILRLIKNSDISIFAKNTNDENVFHAWAKHANDHNPQVIHELWERFKTLALKSPENFSYLHAQNIDAGDTFLHVLCKNKNLSLKTFKKLFSLGPSIQCLSAILVSNNDNKIPLDLIEANADYSDDIEVMYGLKISELCLPLALQDKTSFARSFPRGKMFFGVHTHLNIQNLLNNKKFSRLAKICLLHDGLRYTLSSMTLQFKYNSIPKDQILDFKNVFNYVTQLFGTSELKCIFNGKKLIEYINEQIIKNNDIKLENLVNQTSYAMVDNETSIEDSLAWQRIRQHLETDNSIILSNELLESYTERLKRRINVITLPDLKSGLDYAVLDSNIEMIKFLITKCKAVISPLIFANAMRYIFRVDNNNENLISHNIAIINYMLNSFDISTRTSIRDALASNMYGFALTEPVKSSMVEWLISNHFTPTKEQNHTILQQVMTDTCNSIKTAENSKTKLDSSKYKPF